MANIKLEYGNIHEVSAALNETKTQLELLLDRANSSVSGLVASGFRTPTSSIEFDTQFTDFSAGTYAALTALAQFAKFLETVVDSFEDADSSLASSARELT